MQINAANIFVGSTHGQIMKILLDRLAQSTSYRQGRQPSLEPEVTRERLVSPSIATMTLARARKTNCPARIITRVSCYRAEARVYNSFNRTELSIRFRISGPRNRIRKLQSGNWHLELERCEARISSRVRNFRKSRSADEHCVPVGQLGRGQVLLRQRQRAERWFNPGSGQAAFLA